MGKSFFRRLSFQPLSLSLSLSLGLGLGVEENILHVVIPRQNKGGIIASVTPFLSPFESTVPTEGHCRGGEMKSPGSNGI